MRRTLRLWRDSLTGSWKPNQTWFSIARRGGRLMKTTSQVSLLDIENTPEKLIKKSAKQAFKLNFCQLPITSRSVQVIFISCIYKLTATRVCDWLRRRPP